MVTRIINYFIAHIGPNSEYTWTRLIYSHLRAPTYHLYFEIILLIGIVWLFFQRRYRIRDTIKLSPAEKAALVKEWQPEELVPKDWQPPANLLRQYHRRSIGPIAKYVRFHPDDLSQAAKHANDKPVEHLNFASFNFMNLIGDPDITDAALKYLRKYGVGACGPRGFYGTFDVHIELEEALRNFLNVEKAVVYSYGAATFSSAIPSYAKRTDVIFADEGLSHSALQGIAASRSIVRYFRHNDMQHLEQLLEEQAEVDREDPKRAALTRRFFVVEGLYLDYGDLCPLPALVELKYKYKVRILLDESFSFAAIGSTGRGLTEYFGVNIRDVDLICGSLETSIGSTGGFIAGSTYVVGHQVLSGQGYCFSASAPPMLVAGAIAAIDKLDISSSSFRRLQQLSRRANQLASSHDKFKASWTLSGDIDSPVKHARLRGENTLEALEHVTQIAFDRPTQPLLLTVARYVYSIKSQLPPPSIRLTLNCTLTDEELERLFDVLAESVPNTTTD